LLLWSSFGAQGYALGIARSESGTIQGPWRQDPEPLFAKDGGHGMLFRTFTGKLMLTLHTPNQTPNERPAFFEVIEESGQLSCAKMRSE
jgi:arabinan endo-1,5-alpha-L-arabinosidase